MPILCNIIHKINNIYYNSEEDIGNNSINDNIFTHNTFDNIFDNHNQKIVLKEDLQRKNRFWQDIIQDKRHHFARLSGKNKNIPFYLQVYLDILILQKITDGAVNQPPNHKSCNPLIYTLIFEFADQSVKVAISPNLEKNNAPQENRIIPRGSINIANTFLFGLEESFERSYLPQVYIEKIYKIYYKTKILFDQVTLFNVREELVKVGLMFCNRKFFGVLLFDSSKSIGLDIRTFYSRFIGEFSLSFPINQARLPDIKVNMEIYEIIDILFLYKRDPAQPNNTIFNLFTGIYFHAIFLLTKHRNIYNFFKKMVRICVGMNKSHLCFFINLVFIDILILYLIYEIGKGLSLYVWLHLSVNVSRKLKKWLKEKDMELS